MSSRLSFALPARAARAAVLSASVAAIAACADAPTAAPAGNAAPSAPAAGVYGGAYRVTFSNIGSPDQTATIEADPLVGLPAGRSADRAMTGASLPPSDRGLTLRPLGVGLSIVSTGFSTVGTRGTTDAYRYVYALFRVRNKTAAALSNLVLLALSTPSTFGGTSISNIKLPGDVVPASGTSTTLALGMAPAGSSAPGRTGAMTAPRADGLQIFSEAELAAANIPAPYTGLPYGFSVIDTVADGRSIADGSASSESPGLVLFAFRLPLQATASSDVLTFSYNFYTTSNAETAVTESYQERDATGSAAAATRANAIGATALNVFRGSPNAANPLARTFCTIRTAGTQSSPTQLLGDACSVEYLNPALTVPASATVGVGGTQSIAATVNVRPGFSPPTKVAYFSLNQSVATVSATGVVTGVAQGTTTIYVGLYSTGAYLYTVPVTVTP